MTIDMKNTNRKQSDNKRSMIVKHLEQNSDNTDQYEFKCRTCERRFKSSQALGGHTASHKKIKPKNKYVLRTLSLDFVSYLLHQCKIGMKEFETAGHALGGHMRMHMPKKGLNNVVREKVISRQETEKVESDLESGSSWVLTTVELERRKAEEDERARRDLVLAAKKLQLFLD